MAKKEYDIVVFGATGFTGELTAEYLARAGISENVRWAIAGRDPEKLSRLKKRLESINPALRQELGVLTADINNAESLHAMAASARVVITTVGPYILYGEPVVKACVEAGADYVDLTGEPEFVARMMDCYDEAAQINKLRIINCCGFDSIPHDLGAMYTVQQLTAGMSAKEREDADVQVEGFVRAGGEFSGGTWHSAVHAFARFRETQRLQKLRRGRRTQSDSARRVSDVTPTVRYRKELGFWACPFPTIDPQVVKRSAKLLPNYGRAFRYGHYVQVKKLSRLAVGGAFVGGVFALAQFKPTRDILLKMKHQGDGPSLASRNKGWFKVIFTGQCSEPHGNGKRVIKTMVSGGDPGYGETSKMLAESALCLALDRRRLPHHYGVVTPAAGMGVPLLERLQKAGVRFETL